MSRKVDSPVKTQTAAATLNSLLVGEYHGYSILDGNFAARRHDLVPTETSSASAMGFGRADDSHTVKRRLQLTWNVPAKGGSSALGKLISDNDTSRKLNHRSAGILNPLPSEEVFQQKDRTCPVEVLKYSHCSGRTNALVKDIVHAIEGGIDPLPMRSGLGGAYCFRNSKGDSIAIVKPTDEEPFAPNNPKGFVGKSPSLKRAVPVGEAGYREVAAYLLDHCNSANVPPTILVKVAHPIFNVNDIVNNKKLESRRKVSKIASLQQYISHDCDASDYGTSGFPVAAVHRIGILDVRIFNTDRHAGNLLVRKLGGVGGLAKVELVPIDHGLCLPEFLEDPYFEWIHWPQASVPFYEDELDYIDSLDPDQDCEMLRRELPMIRTASLRVLMLSTIFLKEAAAFGLCIGEIGEMMSRELRGQEDEPSVLELVCIEARRLISETKLLVDFEGEKDETVFDLDYNDAESDSTLNMVRDFSLTGAVSLGYKGGNGGQPPSKLAEAQVRGSRLKSGVNLSHFPTVPKMSPLLKSVNSDSKRYQRSSKGLQQAHRMSGFSASRRSADEQIPTSTSFVNLADMKEEEWTLFLEKFVELLSPAFATRRSVTIRQRQRLGTSCQF